MKENPNANMNAHLVGQLPGRTLESIKKKRQDAAYRELVQEYLREDVDQPPTSSQDEQRGESEDQTKVIKHEI